MNTRHFLALSLSLILIACGGDGKGAQQESGAGNIDLTIEQANEWLLGQCQSRLIKAVEDGSINIDQLESVCACEMRIYEKLDDDERIKLAWFEESLAHGDASSVAAKDRPGLATSAAQREAREQCTL